MLIKTNLPGARKNSISIEDGDKWLEENQHRKAENMTGQINRDARPGFTIISEGKPKSKPVAEVKKSDAKIKKPRKSQAKPGPRAPKPVDIAYKADHMEFIRRLEAGQIVKPGDIGGRSKDNMATMVSKMRVKKFPVITLSAEGKTLVGWIHQDTLDKLAAQANYQLQA